MIKKQFIQSSASHQDRVKGALLGVLIGDALGLGYHWYYDLSLLKHDVGSWVSDYIDPIVGSKHNCSHISQYRYEHGLRAGDNSQTGQITLLLMESIASQGYYDSVDFFNRLDQLLKTLNGEALSGRYTDGIIRELWQKRNSGISWDNPSIATSADTSLGAQLCVILAAQYADSLSLVKAVDKLLRVLYQDHFIRANQLVYALAVQALINGIKINDLSHYLTDLANNRDILSFIGSYGTLQMPGMGEIAEHPELVNIETAKHISLLFGLDCQVTHLLPSAYYLIYRYPENFEMAVLSASNGGGDNMSRAALTGGLSGALNGISGISQRFINGLQEKDNIDTYLNKLADLSVTK